VDAVKGIAELYAGEAALPFVLAGAAGHKLLTAPNGGHVFDDTFVMPYDAAFYCLLQYRGQAPPFG
jgi:hypothetical protein